MRVFVTCSVELRTRHFYVATLFVVRELVYLTRGLRRYDDSSEYSFVKNSKIIFVDDIFVVVSVFAICYHSHHSTLTFCYVKTTYIGWFAESITYYAQFRFIIGIGGGHYSVWVNQ